MLISVNLHLAACLSNQHVVFLEANIPIFHLNQVQEVFLSEKN